MPLKFFSSLVIIGGMLLVLYGGFNASFHLLVVGIMLMIVGVYLLAFMEPMMSRAFTPRDKRTKKYSLSDLFDDILDGIDSGKRSNDKDGPDFDGGVDSSD